MKTRPNVEDCYEFFHLYWERCMGEDASDFTEGLYDGRGSDSKTLEAAQRDQRAYLLDQAQVREGTRILEVGCGLGSLLEDIRERGADGIGLTPSPPQAQRCADKGLVVRNIPWQAAGSEFEGKFDAVIVNGSLEHFVSREEAERGEQEAIYRRFFDRCAAWLDRSSSVKRTVLAFISFNRIPDPRVVAKPTRELPHLSDDFHYRLIERLYRGWYPQGKEQLLRCASERFELLDIREATRDYYLTSLEWSRRARKKSLLALPRALPGLVRWWRSDPDFPDLVRSFYYGSWSWQFTGDDPPCSLNRATFQLRA